MKYSLKKYIAVHFYNSIFQAIVDFDKENDNNSKLYDLEVKTVYAQDSPNLHIEFEVVVVALTEDGTERWLSLYCKGNLAQQLKDFKVIQIEPYDRKSKRENLLTDSLVPILSKEQLDEVATHFLENYYPEALSEGKAISPVKLAKILGLRIKLRPITKENTVLGAIIFCDVKKELYDIASDSLVTERIKGRTILIDPYNFSQRNRGSVNNTIIHECVHWAFHHKAFELERLFDPEAYQLEKSTVASTGVSTYTPTDWMEWQANALTPRIQMPLEPFKKKVQEFIESYQPAVVNKVTIIDALEEVIRQIEKFYGVSKLAAKIRLLDIGFQEIAGIGNYVDGHYVQAHGFKSGFLKGNQTFSISFRDAVFESNFNPKLKEKIESGSYLFVDSHFCMNEPKYIEIKADKTVLTDYARLHMEECCLVFDLTTRRGTGHKETFITDYVLYRDANSDIVFEATFSKDSQINEAQLILKRNLELAPVIRELPGNFSGALSALMKWSEVTEEELSESSLLSVMTIRRMRNDTNYRTSMDSIFQLCIGMKLPPDLSDLLLERSSHRLGMTELDRTYYTLLHGCYTRGMIECNDLLEQLGFKRLGKEE